MVDRELDRDRGPQRAHRGYTGGQGDLPQIPEIGNSRGEPFFKGGLGETGFPKGLLGTIQSIRVAGNPIISNLETIP